MSDEEIESDDEQIQYDEEDTSEDGLQDASGDEESEEGEEGDDEEADEEEASESEAPLVTPLPSQSQQSLQIYVPTSSRSSSPTQQRRELYRADVNAKSYTIEPLAAFPHPVATHSLASSICLTHLLTGSQDGFIRDYDVFACANGKTLLTAPQRAHTGMADTNLKAGVLRSWWENLEDGARPLAETALSPVHSMTLQADALWGLSGTASGNINLFTIRHETGRIHHVLRGHSGPVSSLSLSNDEMSLFSAGWDSNALHWDLNTGQIIRGFSSHSAQLTTVAVRPLGAPIPANYRTWSIGTVMPSQTTEFSTPQPMRVDESQTTVGAPVTSPQASEDAAGESDNDFDPLFDDDAEPPPAHPQPVPAPPPQSAGMTLPSGGGALQLHMPGSNQYPTRTPPPPPLHQLPYLTPAPSKKETPILDPVRYNDFSPDILMTASIDGQVTLWDRRASSLDSRGVGRLEGNERSPPWCVSACWSGDGSHIYAGRRNGFIDVWDVRKYGPGSASGQPRLATTLRNPSSSGNVTCVTAFPDRQHIVCASQDNIRLWNVFGLDDNDTSMHRSRPSVPFKIIAGHHGGIISQILVDASSKFMITASGNRGWFGESSKTVIVHSITPQ
ncbi:WD40-repeat-containing domain protein [Cantharellus anzutake]|uniref:WD40-repeat-containing domain protein n=1 Tax=Cantharellus anzutake TaxID=1750568 RepID=UPI0019063FEA|nr:WD40-repeat-containing domain protein [Cantharellus anzutake]KAF8328886.1 WD40-repeat-containing domain protein [Cantharellus anzutake]